MAVLEEIIKDLQTTIISCMEKEASLEKKIEILRNDNELFEKKEVSLDSRLKSMENDKQSRVLEKSINEMLTRLEEIDTGLQMQVTSVPAIISKSLILTAERRPGRGPCLVRWDPLSATSSSSFPGEEESELTGEFPSSGPNFETTIINPPDGLRQSDDGSKQSPEIVQIPLDDDREQVQLAPAAREVEAAEMAAVPLSDAPLIGAPFRLISFFANYVSGADLVKESSQNDAIFLLPFFFFFFDVGKYLTREISSLNKNVGFGMPEELSSWPSNLRYYPFSL
ncbi:unnamed protein product [Spirodela intermedia]|uniref:Uncharacterized protein n=1 Tax=Spirodela intermedia TaxID=51605 RepID=A0A7I8IHW2_SPIIN|nr:unnamed protein product [Spirodela intermedia]CAA6656966.1 unnamed protein product [Spirodela intermedia]